MLTSSIYRFFAGVFILCLTALGQTQELDTRWQLRVTDLKHKVKVEATIRFSGETATESCMHGAWKRVVVEVETVQDEKFFPLAEPLAYELDHDELTLGRTSVCDGYLFLSGKSEEASIHGAYNAVSMWGAKKIGYFSLKKVR